ncbi:hypothetical protein JCM21900_002809 [Sporobolomyces salmonicolor]
MSAFTDEPIASTSTAPPPSKKLRKNSGASKPSASTPPLGKFLASSEKDVRDKAVASLSRFLSAGRISSVKLTEGGDEPKEELPVGDLDWDKEWTVDSRLAPLEMAKLWKGIFYCFWMSDKPLVQQALAQALADLTLDVRPKSKTNHGRVERFRAAMCYLRGFWEAVVREWGGLDRLRLDKFYMLIRRFVHVALKLLQREEWDERAIAEYSELLTGPGGPLHVTDSKIPHSLAYHLADIFLDELERLCTATVSSESDTPSRTVPLNLLLTPFYTTLAAAPSLTLFTRFTDNVFSPLLDAALPPKPEPKAKRRKGASAPSRPEYPGIMQLALEGQGAEKGEEGEEIGKKVLKRLFVEGGKAETGDVNRRRIYQIVADRDVDLD